MKEINFSELFQSYFKLNHRKGLSIKINPPLVLGTLNLLEKTIICSILKTKKISRIFEFGTFLGSTTSMMALNSKNNSKIVSFDLETKKKLTKFSIKKFNQLKKNYNVKKQNSNDNFLKKAYQKFGPVYLFYLKKKYKKKIQLLKGNSLNYNFNSYENKFDLIFIDGGHNFKTVKADTINSLKMVKKGGMIMWHDASSKIHLDVYKYLKTLNLKLYKYKHTSLSYTLINRK